jgi:hypothetical protein
MTPLNSKENQRPAWLCGLAASLASLRYRCAVTVNPDDFVTAFSTIVRAKDVQSLDSGIDLNRNPEDVKDSKFEM